MSDNAISVQLKLQLPTGTELGNNKHDLMEIGKDNSNLLLCKNQTLSFKNVG